ncbi:mitochondrial sodium/calcium exchanger protein-like isoform X2 [Teleopsis dalmanni]|nr:mitochondrial sodium/calcium exchanger protein-like isoform X2 [Teleopsis dalmanni]
MSTVFLTCIVIFFILNITADRFFCPALKVIATVFGMSEHLAGVTLVAFGNGSPDLFSTLSSVRDFSRAIFSDMTGGAIYVVNFVAGLICVFAPFQMQGYNILRDVSFLTLAFLYIEYAIISDGKVTTKESTRMLIIYFTYLTIILFDQYLLKRGISRLEKILRRRPFLPERTKEEIRAEINILRAEADMQLLSRVSKTSVISTEERRVSSYIQDVGSNNKLIAQFLNSINPFEEGEWENGTKFQRSTLILKIPIRLMLLLFMPICDYELDAHGWSKLLNCLQVAYMPLGSLCCLFRNKFYLIINYVRLMVLLIPPAAFYLFLRTKTYRPPKYHVMFALLTTYGSMFIIYTCACEVVQVLHIFGLILGKSKAFLYCTILAWGNGVGDLVSNLTFAFGGYQKMGFAACLGAPFFNTLLGVGTVYLYRCTNGERGFTPARTGYLGENSFVFLIVTLSCLLTWTLSTNYYARRIMGLFHVAFYILFVGYAYMVETEFMQTFAPFG